MSGEKRFHHLNVKVCLNKKYCTLVLGDATSNNDENGNDVVNNNIDLLMSSFDDIF